MAKLKSKNILNLGSKARIALVGIAAIVVIGGLGYARWGHSTRPITDQPTPQQKKIESQVNANAKKQFTENTGTDSKQNTNPTSSSTQPVSADNVTITTRRDNDSLTVLTKLVGVSTGSCTLTSTNSGQSKVQNTQIIYQTEFSTCAGFSIPVADLGTGIWQLSLAVTSGGATTTKTASAEVK